MPRGIYKHKKGRVHSQETKDKMRLSNLGQKRSDETREKQRLAKLGSTPWNKGKTGLPPSWNKGIELSDQHKQNLREAKLKNPVKYWLGKKRPEIKEYLNNAKAKGNKHWNWKGGINPINDTIRKSLRYKEWRKAVFERDNYACQNCGQIGGRLNADHIMPFSIFEAARFDLGNGRTLCIGCHRNIGWKYKPTNMLIAKAVQA